MPHVYTPHDSPAHPLHPTPAHPLHQPLDAASFLDSFAVAAVASPTADGAPVTPHVDTVSHVEGS